MQRLAHSRSLEQMACFLFRYSGRYNLLFSLAAFSFAKVAVVQRTESRSWQGHILIDLKYCAACGVVFVGLCRVGKGWAKTGVTYYDQFLDVTKYVSAHIIFTCSLVQSRSQWPRRHGSGDLYPPIARAGGCVLIAVFTNM